MSVESYKCNKEDGLLVPKPSVPSLAICIFVELFLNTWINSPTCPLVLFTYNADEPVLPPPKLANAAGPFTDSFDPGLVVPIPTLPPSACNAIS